MGVLILSRFSDTIPTSGTGTDLEWAEDREENTVQPRENCSGLIHPCYIRSCSCLSLIFVCFLSGSLKLFPAYAESLCISFVSFQLKSTNYKSTFSQVKTLKIL